jgi:[NiFe] hydrogenase small subunit
MQATPRDCPGSRSEPSHGRLHGRGVDRRNFLQLCTAVSALLGLGPGGVRRVQAALAGGLRQPVIWLHFAECTGCTESLLRTVGPYFDDLILSTIALDYHETLMVEAGEGAEALRDQAVSKYAGDFLCVVEGSIPTAANGAYGTVGSKTMFQIAAEVLPKAKAIITLGSCSSDGGVASAAPNPASVRGVTDALPGLKVPVIKCPGCPPNPVNFVAILADYLLKGNTPALDAVGRPTFAYGKTVHQNCPFLGTAKCLQSQGCRGIAAFNNCPKVKFNEGTNFCQQSGHVCIGCSEAGFWDKGTFWDATFWKSYPVKVDSGKAGITYAGNPNGIIGSRAPSVDAGTGGSGGNSGTGGQGGAGGRSGSAGTTGSSGGSSGGNSGSSSASGGTSARGGSSGAWGGSSSAMGGSSSSAGASSSGGSSTVGSSAKGGQSSSSASSGSGGTTSTVSSRSGAGHGGGCDVGWGSPPSWLGTMGTLTLLGAAATRFFARKTAVQRTEGDSCPASSSTPSPESKDT